ncbi:helix-turn-helix domain-containing protein [Methylosinus sp. sav-2]|uniref:helix-turn-helix domain-containing protein n=1 Tax=Methylosinus sp. sav-2 TaxID=2485168 RepID=UPI00047A13EA|nr:helix-turn-helix domain-containing protein [Methylosinus sp. sav-2]
MKKVAECPTDAGLAAAINTSRSNIAKWKKRNSVPYAEISKFSAQFMTPVDYLITGNQAGKHRVATSVLNDRVLAILLKDFFAKSLLFVPKERDPSDYAKWLARKIARHYNDIEDIVQKLEAGLKMSRRDAEEAAIVAAEAIFFDLSGTTQSDQVGDE